MHLTGRGAEMCGSRAGRARHGGGMPVGSERGRGASKVDERRAADLDEDVEDREDAGRAPHCRSQR
jgi:hypothetical protein